MALAKGRFTIVRFKKIVAIFATPLSWHLVVSSISAWLLLMGVYLGLGDTILDIRTIVGTLGLSIIVGTLLGIGGAIIFGSVQYLPKLVRFALWIAVGIASGLFTADALGAFAKLGTDRHQLALVSLLVCTISGIGVGILVSIFQPGRNQDQGFFMRIKTGGKVAVLFVLGTAAAACVYIDHTMLKGLYISGHEALRGGAIVATTLCFYSLFIVFLPLPKPRWRLSIASVAVVMGILPFLIVNQDHPVVLQRIGSRPLPAFALDLVRGITDIDMDGHSGVLGGRDCAVFNPNVHPNAKEIPQNGIDDNCRAGDGNVFPHLTPKEVAIPNAPSPMNVILLTIDSVRADHLKTYGYKHNTMPYLHRWSKKAVVFKEAFAVAPWTSIAVPAILRGIYPRRMRWARFTETNHRRLLPLPLDKDILQPKESKGKTFILPSAKGSKPLAFWLGRRGMTTAAIVNDGDSRMLTDFPSISAGFDTYDVVNAEAAKELGGDWAAGELAVKKLDELSHQEPYFFWMHLFGGHAGPFVPPKKYRKFSPKQKNNYDDKLLYADKQLGRVLQAIENQTEGLPTVVIVTADHGEAIDGAKMWHGSGLTEDVLRVPFIVKTPAMRPQKVHIPVGTIDIAPTFFAATNTPAPVLDGADLVDTVKKGTANRRIGLLSDNWRLTHKGRVYTDLTAAYNSKYKLTYNHIRGTESLNSQVHWDEDISAKLQSEQATKLRNVLYRYLEETGGPIQFDKPKKKRKKKRKKTK